MAATSGIGDHDGNPDRTVFLLVPDGARADGHTAATRADLARRLAAMLGMRYGGEYRATGGDAKDPHRPYYVPVDTLVLAQARRLGVDSERDLFGGVVPHRFVATKVISHPVVEGGRVPEGWSHEVAGWIDGAVLPGFSAFSPGDARQAGRRLLGNGPVRFKLACGVGGSDQCTVEDADALDAAVASLDPEAIRRHGVVLEQNVAEPVTYSVGRLRVGHWELAYHGTQQEVADHGGRAVYGGSDLWVVRGGFEALLAQPLGDDQRCAVEYAMRYDAAVSRAWPAFFASRRNYDVVAGRGADGQACCGVLEQSWRIGGASPAELAALAAFQAAPSLHRVHVRCRETYSGAEPPPGAQVHYRGVDAEAGMLCKYSRVEEAWAT